MSKKKQQKTKPSPTLEMEQYKMDSEIRYLRRQQAISKSLDIIRLRTSQMFNSAELGDVIKLVFSELGKLGFQARACDLVIIDPETLGSTLWIAGDLDKPEGFDVQIVVPRMEHAHYKNCIKYWKAGKKLRQSTLKGDRCSGYMNELMDKATLNTMPKAAQLYVRKLTFIRHTEIYMRYGLFRVASQDLLSEEEIATMQQFAATFELTYTRFLDIQKAEAQAREALIEVALERIRSQALAMRQSDELNRIVAILAEEFVNLDIVLARCIIWIINPQDLSARMWMSNSEAETAESYHIPKLNHKYYKAILKAWKARDEQWVYELKGKNKETIDALLLAETEWSRLPRAVKRGILSSNRTIITGSFHDFGMIEVSGRDELSLEQLNILNRFGKVFDQTYTRFLDLQKAESQAREAQIEAAMERVRAASMAMHKSEDLYKVINLLYSQIEGLGVTLHSAQIMDTLNDKHALHLWNAGKGQDYPKKVQIPATEHVFFTRFFSAIKNDESFYTQLILNRQKDIVFKHYFENAINVDVPKQRQDFIFSSPGVVISAAIGKDAVLSMFRFNAVPFLPTENEILKRFSKAFDQSYTRFLDLQKAEAQAREAQIETALERVRTTSMAMHKSKDLHQVINVVYQQLAGLGLTLHSTQISDTINDKHTLHLWLANNVQAYAEQVHVPITRHVFFTRLISAIKNGESFFTLLLSKRQKDNFTRHVYENSKNIDSTKARQDFIYSLPGLAVSVAIGKSAILTVCRFDATPYQPEENEIIKRFSKVFDQTYTRFLDLQKAEAQAREAQIEAALEKVRSTALAMHHSSELHHTSLELYEQLQHLGILANSVNLFVLKEDNPDWHFWSAADQGEYPELVKVPYKKISIFSDFQNAKLAKNRSLQQFYKKRQKDTFFDHLNKHFPLPSKRYKQIKAAPGISCLVAFATNSAIQINFYAQVEFSVAHEDLVIRFAQVFDQAYTRFLDLQKAEVQAREAQIEAALERVRAASMAMHESEELIEVIQVLFDQFQLLDLQFDSVSIVIPNNTTLTLEYWVANDAYISKINIPDTNNPVTKNIWKNLKAKSRAFQYNLNRKQNHEWWKHAFDQTDFSKIPPDRKKVLLKLDGFSAFLVGQENSYIQVAKNSVADFSEDVKQIAKRFSRVFEQCYTRFQDLQKAETQAREAQIEAALEKVRAVSMAMHRSSDLHLTSLELFQQLQSLKIKAHSVNLFVLEKNNPDWRFWSAADKNEYQNLIHIPYKDIAIYSDFKIAIKNNEEVLIRVYSKRQKDAFFKHLNQYFSLPKDRYRQVISSQGMTCLNAFASKSAIQVNTYDQSNYQIEEVEIVKRFAQVFDQAYTRFLDLQKAEAQAREAQIEAALERVRSKTMAMHNSQDVGATVVTLFDEVLQLGLDKSIRVGIGILEGYEGMETWSANSTPSGKVNLKMGMLDMTIHPMLIGLKKAWGKGESGYSYDYIGDDVFTYYQALNNEPEYPFQADLDSLPENEYHKSFFYNEGILFSFAPNPISEEAAIVLNRFAGVFGQTYRRYLDLQKAEAQAREAKIETALERVRAKTMAMHHSDELRSVIAVVFEQLTDLGFETDGCSLVIYGNEGGDNTIWLSGFGSEIYPESYKAPYYDHPYLNAQLEAWKEGIPFRSFVWEGKLKKSVDEYYFQQTDYRNLSPEIKAAIMNFGPSVLSDAFMSHGFLEIAGKEEISEEQKNILQRFASVFDQTYTRFLDIQKAEAQAKEAQIETALERVRSKSLAMHNTDELQDVIFIVFDQLKHLGIEMDVAFIQIFDDTMDTIMWVANPQQRYAQLVKIPYRKNPILDRVIKAREQNESFMVDVYSKKDKNQFYRYAFKHSDLKTVPKEIQNNILKRKGYARSMSLTKNAALSFFNLEGISYSNNENEILRRFSKVFDQAYTRFLDLQKAEAQAREAEIEAALERLRAASMAMHKSEELTSTAYVMFQELIKLGIQPWNFSFIIFRSSSNIADCWASDQTGALPTIVLPHKADKFLIQTYKDWKSKESFTVMEAKGAALRKHQGYMKSIPGFDKILKKRKTAGIKSLEKMIFHNAHFKYGYLMINTLEQHPEFWDIFQRFAKVFEQTYTRFLDLKKAEAQVKEAEIETALERLRASTMAMHISDDVALATIVMFDELIQLGLESERCGIAIPLDQENIEFWAATSAESGETIRVVGQEPLNLHPSLQSAYDAWEQKKEYQNFTLEGKDLVDYYQSVKDTMPMPDWKERMRTAKGGMEDFSTFPFTDGWVYIFRDRPLDEDTIQLLKRFAQVFDQTYTRYLDLQRAEEQTRIAEKQNKELAESYKNLQQTQAQLIQSEKMASLGELTAGIAHEIQNPLNFVNNFSEVSGELLDEMKEELASTSFGSAQDGSISKQDKEKMEDVMEIIDDLKQNLQKIHHHGGRADSIVKGMLQHSRTSTGEKVPTDINALADEYLRLAYHGLRAKDNTFNASIETHFDESIGKINVIPQDIGRVLLNLITNAFQATHEKSQNGIENYTPKVTVSTQRLDNYTTLTVQDNGLGIPDSIKDKIFQPFFTTKPTGSGTGLGLSLAYDIVKAHGGDLKVESEKGKGSTFIITI